MVSDALRAPLAEGVKTNLCLIGAMPSVSWLNDVAERDATCVAETCSGAMQTKRRIAASVRRSLKIDCVNVQRARLILIRVEGPETVIFVTPTLTASATPAAEAEHRISTAKHMMHIAVRMTPIDAAHAYVRILKSLKCGAFLHVFLINSKIIIECARKK